MEVAKNNAAKARKDGCLKKWLDVEIPRNKPFSIGGTWRGDMNYWGDSQKAFTNETDEIASRPPLRHHVPCNLLERIRLGESILLPQSPSSARHEDP